MSSNNNYKGLVLRIAVGFAALMIFLFASGSGVIYAAGETPPPPPSVTSTSTPPPPPSVTSTSTPPPPPSVTPTSNPTSSSGTNSGSSGSGGGGGGTSGEAFSNIEIKEKYDLDISKDLVTSYRFTSLGNIILFVNITGNSSRGETNTAVEVLKNTSSLVKNSPPGIVYKNINIWVGTSGFAVPANIKNGEIKFKIDNSWLSSNNLESSDIKMVRWDGSAWKVLETNEYSRNITYTYFAAKTNAFSPFAIIGLKSGVVATSTSAGMESQGQTGTAISPGMTLKASGFEVLLMLITLSVVYILSGKRR